MNSKFGTLAEAAERRRNKKPGSYRRALLKVDGHPMTLDEIEKAVGFEVTLERLRQMQLHKPLTIERIRSAYSKQPVRSD